MLTKGNTLTIPIKQRENVATTNTQRIIPTQQSQLSEASQQNVPNNKYITPKITVDNKVILLARNVSYDMTSNRNQYHSFNNIHGMMPAVVLQ